MIEPYKIEYYRGDFYPKIFTFTDETTGDAIDLTGVDLILTVSKDLNPTNTDNELFKITGMVVDAATGVASFTPGDTDNDLAKGTYYYDVSAITGSTSKRTLVKGKWVIDMDIGKD